MANYNKMTQNKFNAIKTLLKGGATYEECAKYMLCGTSVIYKIKIADTWEDYLQQNAARAIAEKKAKEQRKLKAAAAKSDEKPVEQPVQQVAQAVEQVKAQVVEHRQNVTIVANQYMAEQLKLQTELLTIISNKLAYIVEQLS